MVGAQLRRLLDVTDGATSAAARRAERSAPEQAPDAQVLLTAAHWRDEVAAVLAAPRLAGALADRLGAGLAVAAFQALAVDTGMKILRPAATADDRLRLAARIAFGLDVDPATLPAVALEDDEPDPVVDDPDPSTGVLDAVRDRAGSGLRRLRSVVRRDDGRPTAASVLREDGEGGKVSTAKAVWRFVRLARTLQSIGDDRVEGPLGWRLVGALPVVGVVGGFFAERSAFEEVARRIVAEASPA